MAAAGVTTPADPGRGLDHVAGAPVAPGRAAMRRCATAIWWPSTPGWSPAATSASWAAPGRRRRRRHRPASCRGAADELWDRLLAACRPGAPLHRPARRLRRRRRAAAAHAGRPGTRPGLRPAAGDARAPADGRRAARAGHGLALTAYVWKEGVGARLPAGAGRHHRRRSRARCRPSPIRRSKEPDDVSAADVPPAEEIILYEKDPVTRIATITLNRPDQLNIPTIAARAPLRRPAVQGQHRRRRQGARRPRCRRPPRLGRRPRRADGQARRQAPPCTRSSGSTRTTTSPCPARARTAPARRCCTGTPIAGRAAGPCRTSRRSASSRSRATATAGTSTRRPTPTSSISSDDALFGHPAFRYVG